MQSKSAALQDQINELDLLIQQGSTDAQLNLWEMQRKELQDQLKVALAEEAERETVTESAGFVFDTLEVDGLTAPEIITDDNQYKLIRKGVQSLVVNLITDHSTVVGDLMSEYESQMKTLGERAIEAEYKLEKLQADNKDLEVKNYELGLENEELSEKVKKIAELQHEANQQIEQQKQHIAELQNQIAIGVRGALNVVNVPQDTSKLAAEIIASKPRIMNVRFKDENGIDRRIKKAEYVLNGETFEYEGYTEKRYIILDTPEKVEQYRADEANKKAEQEQVANSIPETKEPDVLPVNPVTEEEAPAQENSFQVQTAESGLVDQSLSLQGAETNEIEHEDMKLFPDEYLVTMKQFNALAARVENIERHANIQAVA